MKQSSIWRSVASLTLTLLVVSVFTLSAPAQQTLGSINGTVTDSSGAAIPGATVTVTDTSINVVRTTTSHADGYFQIFNLPIGIYKVRATRDGFETTDLAGITVQEARATTVQVSLKVGQVSTSVEVIANPLLNATDTTNGYTMDTAQIAATPLATGSFTQLAVLSPGTSAELLASLDSNAGLGNQPIWANGQRDTSNTFQVDGVDVTNIFNGKSSSDANSQRYNFGVGETDPVGGEYGSGTSVYESNGNSLPSPPPEFMQEVRVNTSMYDAQQGATAGAQIDVNTLAGTNAWHGEVYGSFANNSLNAAPFFFKEDAILSQQGIGAFPLSDANPALHRWTTGGTIGGPVKKDKLFFFLGYQHGYNSDQATGLSQLTVPAALNPSTCPGSDTRTSTAYLDCVATNWNNGKTFTGTISPIAAALMQATVPGGGFMIPNAQNTAPYSYGVPNVTLNGTSIFTTDQATASLDYNLTPADRLSFKYFYQNDPVQKPFGLAQVPGFPLTQNNGAQLGVLDNTIALGSRFNWEQRLGYVRMSSYSFNGQTVIPPSGASSNFGIGSNPATTPSLYKPDILPGLDILETGAPLSSSPGITVGPYGTESTTINTGYYQNRLNPSTNAIFTLGKHTIMAGGGFSYTQLNIENNRGGIANIESKGFENFIEGKSYKSNVIDTIDPTTGRNDADRYYRSNEIDTYVQDKWQLLSNLSITAGVRYDYHGGLTEKYGNFFTFNPSLYDVTGTSQTGYNVVNTGFVIAPNNHYANTVAGSGSSLAGSNSTLVGRQWGISPRVGFAWSPERFHNKIVVRGGGGIYYDRGELFSYLSQPYGASGGGGVFGVTQSQPLVSYISGSGSSLADPIGTPSYLTPSGNPSSIKTALQSQLDNMAGPKAQTQYGPKCGAIDNQENYLDCTPTIDFGSYDPHNVLPYTINYTLNIEWQPTNDTSVSIGYVGNRGRHAVIPIPFNEPETATGTNSPAMILGKEPHAGGETSSYGYQVLNEDNIYYDSYGYAQYNSIAGEPWNSYSGGNIDYRTPYVGYNFNASLFETVGNSSYDALQAQIQKRFSHHYQAGASYTWSHTLDEQSDIGIFFTGDDPEHLKDSYASADFDRTHVLSVNLEADVPDFAAPYTLASYFENGWSLTGVGIAQSGEPYSLYEFYGAVGSISVGNYPNLMNPVLGIQDPGHPKAAKTGNKGVFRGAGGDYLPTIDPTKIAINYLAPGTDGIPVSTGSDPSDIFETGFAPTDQRNIFRQPFQKRVDLSIRKNFKFTEKYGLQYAFNIFNITNTTSLDVPQNQTQIGQADACANSAYNDPYSNCSLGYLNYGQVVTSSKTSAADQLSARNNLYVLPVVNGSGKSLNVPTTLSNGQGTCFSTSCPNNGATFGSITGVIGGARAFTMGLHFTY